MVTNFFRIEIPFEEFQIQRLPYSEKKLVDLRGRYNQDASFFRSGDFIYISPRKDSGLELGELTTILIDESSGGIVLSLIRHLIFRAFREAFPDRIPESFSPLRFFSTKPEHDPVRRFLPQELQGQISYPTMVEVKAQQISERGKPSFGLLIGSRQRWQFKVDLRNLIGQGFDLRGRTVLETIALPGLEGVLAPDETLLGEIVSIHSDEVEITTNDGLIRRKIDSLQLQRTQEQIGAFLEFKLGKQKATELFQNIREDRIFRSRPDVSFSEAAKFANWFSQTKTQPRLYQNDDGFCFTVTTNNVFEGSSVPIHSTNLIFDYGPGASASKPMAGLSKFGPFNAARFERNDLRMLVLFHPQSRGAATQFLKRLIDGIPESQYFQRGLKALFRLTSVEPVLKELKNTSVGGYEEAIDEAIRDADSRGFDIALIECPDGSKFVPTSENQYYRARARLMSYGIPTQGVRDDHLRAPVNTLQWTLGPIALQIYAKVGGTPWRLPATQSVDREILVGIGHSLERPNLWAGAEQSRIVGITTFFLGDGSYMLAERLRSVPYEHYFEELLKALKTSIDSVAQEYAWKEGESVRIVFHIFKPIKNVEADVVARLVESFPQFKILFAFVTISTEHPWMMFRGASKNDGQTSVTLCERGDNLFLDSRTCLLQIRGDSDRPNKNHRPPYPVLIRVHEKSTYKDLKFIAQQIHDFAYLSWRGFYPSDTPVTVFYSNLIVKESSKLNKIPGWNAAFLDQHFRRKQWFL
jgi:hypothetical protein